MARSYQFVIRGLSGLLIFMAITSLMACGGGGGGSDDVPSECRTYCRSACAKVGVCNRFNENQIEECRKSCVDLFAEDGTATPQECQNATAFILNASCSQLDQIIGIRSADASQLRMSQGPTPGDCGAALGLEALGGTGDE